MKKIILRTLMLMTLIFLLTGCWDYVGLNQMTIVTGIAIDKDIQSNKYILTFEIVDLVESEKSNTTQVKTIEATGDTVFDATRNARKKISDKLNFTHAQIVIISNQIAKEEGIKSIIDWFLRDAEVRQTMHFVISQGATAKELFTENDSDKSPMAYEIEQIILGDSETTSSTKNILLYEIFDVLKTDSDSLVLPLFHTTEYDNNVSVETSGIAAFKKDKLIGYLDSDESKYYLFIDNSVSGGVLTLNSSDKKNDNISLEISHSKTSKKYSYKENKFKIYITTNTEVYLGEYDNQSKPLDKKQITKIETQASSKIESNIKKIIGRAKNEFNTDIFGFSNLIFNGNPKLWKKIKGNWDFTFKNLDVDVKANVKILNIAALK